LVAWRADSTKQDARGVFSWCRSVTQAATRRRPEGSWLLKRAAYRVRAGAAAQKAHIVALVATNNERKEPDNKENMGLSVCLSVSCTRRTTNRRKIEFSQAV